jgi:hypothetical protein
MMAVIEFPALGKGLFALKKTVNVIKGAECSLQGTETMDTVSKVLHRIV